MSVRLGAGGILRCFRTLRIVPSPTRWPRRRSSPWILRCPHPGWSCANVTIRSRIFLGIGGRPGERGWVHFFHQASVPGQQRCRRHDPMRAQLARQKPGQSRQHRPVGPGRLRAPNLTTQNLDLMPEREYLGVVRRVVAGKERKPGEDLEDELVDQFHDHGHQACGTVRTPRLPRETSVSIRMNSGSYCRAASSPVSTVPPSPTRFAVRFALERSIHSSAIRRSAFCLVPRVSWKGISSIPRTGRTWPWAARGICSR